MRLTRKTPMATQDSGPERPSHFDQDVNEYAPRNNTLVEYDTEEVHPRLGFDTPPPEPQPVYLTETPPKDTTLRRANRATLSFPAGSQAQPIAGADRRRRRLYVRNNDADTDLLLLSKATDGPMAAFTLPPGQSIEEFHNDAVWAKQSTNGDAAVTSVSVLAEFEVDD